MHFTDNTDKELSIETFFERKFIQSDLIKILQFLEYDNDIICNPKDVNHHNANTGEKTFKQLQQKCAKDITQNIESNDSNDMPFKSFEFVLYKKCAKDTPDTFDIKRTIPPKKKQNESDEIKNNGIFLIPPAEIEQFMNCITSSSHHNTSDHTIDIVKKIETYQKTSQLRLGIVDGLHRLTAFNKIIRPLKSSALRNVPSCFCHIYIWKQNEPQNIHSSELIHMFKMKSQLISKNQAKSISHTLFDNIMELVERIDTQSDLNYIQQIKETSLTKFTKSTNKNNKEDSFCAKRYLNIFIYSHEKLLEDCKIYNEEFKRRFLNTKSTTNKPASPSDKNYLTDIFPAILNTPFTMQAIPRILSNENPDHSLTKQHRFCVPCACVHRLLSAYMTFEDRDDIQSGLRALEQLGLATLHDISLMVIYADILATNLLESMKGKKRDFPLQYINFHRVVSNYFITSLLKGIDKLQELPNGLRKKMFKDWGMAYFPGVTTDTKKNTCCENPSDELANYIDWEQNNYMTIIGIYFNYATHIMNQASLFPKEGFITSVDMKKKERDKKGTMSKFFTLPDYMHLDLREEEENEDNQSKNNNKEYVPITFHAFITSIRESLENDTQCIYQEQGKWQIYEPHKIGRRYKGWNFKNVSSPKPKVANELEITLSYKSYKTYEEWQKDQILPKEQLQQISTKIIEGFLQNGKFIKHVTSILKEQELRIEHEQKKNDDMSDESEAFEELEDDTSQGSQRKKRKTETDRILRSATITTIPENGQVVNKTSV